jgi:hypothetical protein
MYSIERNHVEVSYVLSLPPSSRVDFEYSRLPEVVEAEDLSADILDVESPAMEEVDVATTATHSRKRPKA